MSDTPKYEIIFHDRTVRVLRGGASLVLGRGDQVERYESIAEAAETALETLRSAVDSSVESENFATQHFARLNLRLVGEERELDAACINWHVRWGTDLAELRGLKRETRTTSPSIYDTLGFGSHVAQVEAIRSLLKEWEPLATRALARDAFDAIPREIRQRLDDANRKPRIGIVGVTGAGKSAFINALLGQEIASVSEGNATGCITEFVWARNKATEGVQVTPRDKKELQALIKEFRGDTWLEEGKATLRDLAFKKVTDSKSLIGVEEYDRKKLEIEAFEHCLQIDPRKIWPLTDVTMFTNVEKGSLAHGIQRVTVHLHTPVLERVTLVDTPGTRDVAEHRARAAIEQATMLEGWFYLTPIIDAPTTTVREEWTVFDKRANNKRAALVLTKLDLQSSTPFRDAERTRSDEYRREGWGRPIVACSAAPHFGKQDNRWRAFILWILGLSEGKDRAAWRAANHRLEELEEVRAAWKIRALDDYTRDLAGIVRAGVVMAGVAEEVYLLHARISADGLREAVENCSSRLKERENSLEADREAWDKLEQLEAQQAKDEARLEELRDAKKEHEKGVHDVAQRHETADEKRLRDHVDAEANWLMPSEEKHEKAVRQRIKHLMWGALEFNVLEEFEVPLADTVQRELESILMTLEDMKPLVSPAAWRRIEDERVLTNVTLVAPSRVVTDGEKWHELLDNSLKRMYPRSTRSCRRAAESVLERAMQVLDQKRKAILEIASEFAQADELRDFALAVSGRARTIVEKRKSPADPPARLDQQLFDVRAVLADIVAFKNKLPQDEHPERP